MEKENKGTPPLKRKRSANWDSLEKKLLRSYIKEFVSIIENKNTDTNTNKSKNDAWKKIYQRFNEINSRERSIVEIKQQWRTSKLEAKKIVSDYKRERSGTGGGQKPPSPGHDTYEIVEMIPKEFEVDFNKFDSDGINTLQFESQTNPITNLGASTTDTVEVIQMIDSPSHDNEYIEEIIATPLSTSQKENLGIKKSFKSSKKRKLPLEANDLAKERTKLLTNCIQAEHDLKMQQMRESHEWAQEEHQLRLKEAELRLKEAELRIENLQMENLLLKKNCC